jgi:hypothetical protein
MATGNDCCSLIARQPDLPWLGLTLTPPMVAFKKSAGTIVFSPQLP